MIVVCVQGRYNAIRNVATFISLPSPVKPIDPLPLTQAEALVSELHRLGVRHLVLMPVGPTTPWPPVDLLCALAQHPEARLRSALRLLFLRRPSWHQWAVPAVQRLLSINKRAADTLQLYYQAAVYLRPELAEVLAAHSDDLAPLPDLFSAALGVPQPGTVTVAAALAALGARHAELTGQQCNWVGAYRQHLVLFVRQLQS